MGADESTSDSRYDAFISYARDEREKVLLPLYCGVDEEVVGEYSPSLANLHALTVTEDNVGTVAKRLYEVIDRDSGEAVSVQIDGVTVEDRVEPSADPPDDGEEADAVARLIDLGDDARVRAEYDEARDYYERSLELARTLGYQRGIAASLVRLGNVALLRDEYDEARDCFERSLDLFREIENRKSIAMSLNNLGLVAELQGEYDEAREYYERSLKLYRELGDRESAENDLERSLEDVEWRLDNL